MWEKARKWPAHREKEVGLEKDIGEYQSEVTRKRVEVAITIRGM